MKSFIKSITTKYIIIGLLIIGLVASFTSLSFWFTNRIKDDARRINLAGKGRMLNFEMAWLLNPDSQESLRGQDDEKTEPLNYLENEIAIFEEILYALRDGDRKYKLGPLSQGDYLTTLYRKKALDKLDGIIGKWHSKIRPTLIKAVEGSPEAFREYNTIINGYVDEIDSFVSHLEQNYKKEFVLYTRVHIVVIVLSVLVFISLIFFTRKSLVKPILRLRDAAKAIEKGNLDISVKTETVDEVGELGDAFNSMVRTRKEAEAKISQNYHIQRVINSVLQTSLSSISLDKQLESVMDLIFSIPYLSVESKGCIFLIEDNPEVLVMKTQRKLTEPLLSACKRVPLGQCLCGQAASSREIIFANCIDDRHKTRLQDMPPHGHLCIPIQSGSRLLGVINLYLEEGHQRNPREEEFLTTIVNTLAGTIERRQAEEALKNHSKKLSEQFKIVSRSKKEWQETFDSITDLISIHDKDCNIIKANRAFAEHFGLTPQELINKKCYDIFHGIDSPVKNCPHKKTLNENRPMTEEILDPKSNRVFRISVFPYYSPDGKVAGSVHIAKDITEEREKEMHLIMSERLASLGQMSAGIAHEINNPLAAIAGCAEGLLSRMKKEQYDPELFKDYLGIIEEEISRCKGITTNMLSFIKQTTYEKRDLNINETIDKTLDIIRFQGRLRSVEVLKKYAEELPVIHRSEGELRQVFMTIFINGLDAMEDKGIFTIKTGIIPPHPPLHLGSQGVKGGEGGFLFIEIRDTGTGMPDEHISRIFDPFFTTKSEKGGTGLGLSIASKIIANQNGSIHVTSAEGKGTTFRITLPV